MIPTSDHNEALSGDTLYSAFLNYQWREIVMPFVIAGMEKIAASIENETDRQDFEVRYGALIDDFYNEDIVDNTPIGAVVWLPAATIPAKWHKCDGTLLYEADYPALYALLVDYRGSDAGGNYVALPDLRFAFLYGSDTDAHVADTGGATQHTLSIAEMPAHNHAIGTDAPYRILANTNTGGTSGFASSTRVQEQITNVQAAGGSQAHNNMPPYHRGYHIMKVLP